MLQVFALRSRMLQNKFQCPEYHVLNYNKQLPISWARNTYRDVDQIRSIDPKHHDA
jgi:hypothetical protein